MRVLAILVFISCLLWIPAAWLIDRSTGVTGYEMASVLPEQDRPTSLADWGLDPADPVAELLTAYGKPGASVSTTGEQHRFVMVPSERRLETELGTLVVFDRAAGEELMQAKSLYNLAYLATGAGLIAWIFLLIAGRLRRSLPADDQSIESAP